MNLINDKQNITSKSYLFSTYDVSHYYSTYLPTHSAWGIPTGKTRWLWNYFGTLFKNSSTVHSSDNIPTREVDKYKKVLPYLGPLFNIISVVEFQRWWVLKSKLFGQDSTCHQGKILKKFLRVLTVSTILDVKN